MDLFSLIRDVPDFPSPGIMFKDITPLLADPVGTRIAVEAMADPWAGKVGVVAGIESRGFIFGPLVAHLLGVGFVPVRKAGKLPGDTIAQSYALEYGTATLEVHTDAFTAGAQVLVLDDVLATGGTANAAADLVAAAGGDVVGFSFLMELAFLGGASVLQDRPHHAVLRVD